MKKVYVTITGMKYYYGFNPFSIGKKLTCKKEHNNPYDSCLLYTSPSPRDCS